MSEIIVNSLFENQPGFENAQALVEKLNARKRGPYDIKPKVFEYEPYAHIRNLHIQLNNLIETQNEQIGFTQSICENIEGINCWFTLYSAQQYEYNGHLYQGEEFRYIEAEIAGTECFDIYDRIKLHQGLINLLRAKVPLAEAMQSIQREVKELQKHYEKKEITKWLQKQRRG